MFVRTSGTWVFIETRCVDFDGKGRKFFYTPE